MKLYDECIKEELALLHALDHQGVHLTGKDLLPPWKEGGPNDLIFGSDMAFELGGGTHFAISEQMLTVDDSFVKENEVLLYGPDINEIKGDCDYAKILIIKVKEDAFDGVEVYERIRAIQYTRYHVYPLGYMLRVSSSSLREQARVSKDAVKEGVSFMNIGANFIKAYSKYPQVEAVKVIFITDPTFDYKKLEELAKKSEGITSALDHVLKDVTMNCAACSVKEICDEVEGMKEMHFAKAQ